jgi:hypothetical protein
LDKNISEMRVDSFFFDGQSFDILFAALVVAGGTAQRASQARKSPFDFIVYIVGTAGIQISNVIMRFCGEPESVCAVERQRIEKERCACAES